jgi:hypothetical protein
VSESADFLYRNECVNDGVFKVIQQGGWRGRAALYLLAKQALRRNIKHMILEFKFCDNG